MEKYSRWRDAGTGIQPFLPPAPVKIQKRAGRVALDFCRSYLFGPLLGATRVLLLGPMVLMALVGETLCSLTVTLKKGRATSPAGTDTIRHGDLILANHVSYIDVLYLYTKYNPMFVRQDPTATQPDRFSAIPFREAFWGCTTCPRNDAKGTSTTLSALTRDARRKGSGPIVLFIEGTTSNGRALLHPLETFRTGEDVDPETRLHLLLFKYSLTYPSPAFPIGNLPWHVLRQCCQFDNPLQVKQLNQHETPKMAEIEAALRGKAPSGSGETDMNTQIAQLLANMGRLRITKLGFREKATFLEYYKQQTGGKTRR
ncbi:Vacuolar protein sorting protein vps66 [Dispira parvispora]|uniref:Vacuolar protein sorting protein vps66 n=1 Tax=Dispira parvispora TaxID=1520584 RepID=A0A9W8E499_9FUNG|nr:Vacuolar protein sorting protein vps66 [Dispira parvispora]